MSRIVFLGPTLRRGIAEHLCDAEFHPPAAMGDMTRAASRGPEAIVLIDGIFEDRPSVWHKEILWALSRDVPVIGASSMGALRAAELDAYGMLGWGKIYAAYASGELGDDDEVAVVHGPAEMGHMALSDAMVDIRDTVATARAGGVVTGAEAEAIISHAKARHFKERSLFESVRAVLSMSRAANPSDAIGWFGMERPGLKAIDASDVFSRLDELVMLARDSARRAPPFVPTIYLHRLEPFGYSP